MAEEVAIVGTNAFAKKRSPWGVFGLTLITARDLRILLVVLREQGDGRARPREGTDELGDSPGKSARGALPGLPDHRAAAGLVLPRHAAHAGGRAAHGRRAGQRLVALIIFIVVGSRSRRPAELSQQGLGRPGRCRAIADPAEPAAAEPRPGRAAAPAEQPPPPPTVARSSARPSPAAGRARRRAA